MWLLIRFVFFFQPSDDENSDNSNECVVCLSDLRDTLILPCRHLCLCNSCADTLRYQANNCPICRLRKKCYITLMKLCSLRCFINVFWREVNIMNWHYCCDLIWPCVPLTSLQSFAADQSCEEKAWCSFPRVLQPRSGPDYGPWRALSKSPAHLCIIS